MKSIGIHIPFKLVEGHIYNFAYSADLDDLYAINDSKYIVDAKLLDNEDVKISLTIDIKNEDDQVSIDVDYNFEQDNKVKG